MQTVVITGANRGIGLALVERYEASGAKVIAICRGTSAQLQRTKAHIIAGIDLVDTGAFAKVVNEIGRERIDVLINNAGILRATRLGQLEPETLLQQFSVNAAAPLLLAEALLPSMGPGAKLAFITSRMGSIADNGSGGSYGYRMSKAALNAAAKSLAIDLAPREIAVGIYHPGYVRTDMVGGNGDVTAREAAQSLMERIAALNLQRTGEFLHARGEPLPW